MQTAQPVIVRALLMTTDNGDLVLDPTYGTGTTAYVAEQWGRRWITVDTSRVALALARTRLMAAKYPYYLLADSPERVKKEAEITGQVPPMPLPKTENDVKKGFMYRRVPHITLKSIANNEEIDAIHARWQEDLEPVRGELNRLLGRSWEEWQVPREAGEDWPARARELLGRWWELRRGRQKEVDASIARRADTELLYDQPYEDNKRIRVTGPFTVESLSPHRVLATEEERPGAEVEARREFLPAEKPVEKGIVVESTKQFGKLVILLARMNPDLAMGDELLKKTRDPGNSSCQPRSFNNAPLFPSFPFPLFPPSPAAARPRRPDIPPSSPCRP